MKNILKYLLDLLPAKLYLTLRYFYTFKRVLNFNSPQTFNEKIQYLKLYQTEQRYSDLADKYKVRAFVEAKLGADILPKLYWVGDSPEEIPYDTLPNRYTIKCNHGCGYNILIKDKSEVDKEVITQKLSEWLTLDFSIEARELQYKNIERKILIEEFLYDEKTVYPIDYKVYSFGGKPEFVQANTGRFTDHRMSFYSFDWVKLDFGWVYPLERADVEKPRELEKMAEYSKILSAGLTFVRVDFYEVNGKVYFGEMTFTPHAGFGKLFPDHDSMDKKLGELLVLDIQK